MSAPTTAASRTRGPSGSAVLRGEQRKHHASACRQPTQGGVILSTMKLTLAEAPAQEVPPPPQPRRDAVVELGIPKSGATGLALSYRHVLRLPRSRL